MATLIAPTVLGNLQNLEKFSIQQYNQIRVIIGRLNIPKNYRVYGFKHRIFNWDQYREQQGFINLYLLSNVSAERSLEQPLISWSDDGSSSGMSILSMVSALQRPGGSKKYLDVSYRVVLTRQQTFDMLNKGVDGGQLGGRDPPKNGW